MTPWAKRAALYIRRHIAWLHEADRPAGPQSVSWDAGGMNAGIGFVELLVDGERAVRRVAIVP